MTINPHQRLAELGLRLPPVSPPRGAYVPAVVAGSLVYVAGQVPMVDGQLIASGRVGDDISLDEARALSERCILSALAAVESVAGLSRVDRVVRVVGYVASAAGFTQQPAVVDGASDVLLAVFGENGRHARTTVGVAELPLGSPVEIELTVAIRT